jgi:FkbM family methyltransferase
MGEKYFLEKIQKFPNNQPGLALDIGANHGMYTKLLAEKFQLVYAVEPHPDNFRLLSEKAISNVTYINMAIGLKEETIKLYTNINPGGHTTSHTVAECLTFGHNINNYISVKSISLDQLCANKLIKCIKMDVEGAEDFIFDAGLNTIQNNLMHIFLEVHQKVDYDKLYNFFTKNGYKIYLDDVLVNTFTQDSHYLVTNIQNENI